MSEPERNFEEAINITRGEIPDWSDNKGFWSGGKSTIEYKPKINVKEVEQHFGSANIAKNEEFLLACRYKKTYEIGFTKNNLFFRSSTSEGFYGEPLGNVEPFYVKNVAVGMLEERVFCIPLVQIKKASIIQRDDYFFYRLRIILSNNELIELDLQCILKEHNQLVDTLIGHCQPLVIDNLVNIAKKHEKLLEFDEASAIYKDLGMDEELIRVREEQRNKVNVDQNVVHGDQISNTEIKNSVLNRSSVGSGSSKAEELREAKSLLDDGVIDDDEFKQMKKDILGK